MDYGFVRVGAAVPVVRVADCRFNAEIMLEMIKEAEKRDVQILVFPELSLTAYTCGDLFHQQALLDESQKQLKNILEATMDCCTAVVAGLPLCLDNQLFDCAVVMQRGLILGIVPKTYIPGYKEFYEERWFAPGKYAISRSLMLCGQEAPFGCDLLFQSAENNSVCFGVEICEDLWVPVPPSSNQALAGATILCNPSASNDIIGKSEYRKNLVSQQSGRCIAGYVYASCGINESTTDVVFGGHAIIAENGGVLAESQRFVREGQIICTDIDVQRLINDRFKNTSFMEAPFSSVFRKIAFNLAERKNDALERTVYAYPFVPSDIKVRDERCGEIFAIQTSALIKRLLHTDSKHAVIGISGGLDSTLALLVTAKAFDRLRLPRWNIHAVTMPGFGTTDMTYDNALRLMNAMEVGSREIDIRAACLRHFEDIGHDAGQLDVTYENVQARERTQILMDIANKIGGLVIGTGDLSELALGWCTYNGDHMSMYAVNASIPKTLVRYLVQWVKDNAVDKGTGTVLQSILETPISPELLPPTDGEIKQKTEEIIGPYELHDFFLYHMVRYGASPGKILYLAEKAFEGAYRRDTIKDWLKVFYKRFFSQQFKRSCMPDGPKVGTISLSPRGDWRMPSDASARVWLEELDGI